MLSNESLWAIGLACLLMLGDMITGFITACLEHDVSSSVMREGLLHKTLVLCVIGLAAVVEATGPRAGVNLGIPAVNVVCAYVALMEISSIVENVGRGYPAFKDTRIYEIMRGDAAAPPDNKPGDSAPENGENKE